MLSEGRGDIVVEDQSIAEENIQKLGLRCSVSIFDGITARSGFHIMIGRNSEFFPVMNSLDSALDEMWTDGTIERVLAEYALPAVR
jgi:ABC-type amino acid transport substrate-binding protein